MSRYLFSQLLLNASFGLLIAAGLALAGLDYALLWGIIAALMRYVPYLGTWIGVLPPVVYSFATSSGLAQPIGVFAFYALLEITCNYAIEPWLFGSNLGVSSVALLIAAGFWSFLWGPIGLILSGPLTTCLVVLGWHVPPLRFLAVLLGDEPALPASAVLFQRLASRDYDEASRLLRAALADDAEPIAAFDALVLPALHQLRLAVLEGSFDAAEEAAFLAGLRTVIDDVVEDDGAEPATELRVLIVPARDAIDRAAVDLMAIALAKTWTVETTTPDMLDAEVVARAVEVEADAVVIGSVPPGGLTHTRRLGKRLHAAGPEIRLAAGRWGATDTAAEKEDLATADITAIGATLAATRQQLDEWRPVLEAQAESQERRTA